MILQLLGTVILLSNRKQHMRGYLKDLNKVLQENRFDPIHIHGNSGTLVIEVLGKSAPR